MQKEAQNKKEDKRRSLAEIVDSSGPMDKRKAMEIIKTLCGLLMEETGVTEADMKVFNPQTVLISSDGKISFQKVSAAEASREAYLPPEYEQGRTSNESIYIYGLGMLLLYLLTGQDKKSVMDTDIRDRSVKDLIDRCTALDSKYRYQSLTEVHARLRHELILPKKNLKRFFIAVIICLVAGASVYMYLRGRNTGDVKGLSEGYVNGYRDGYDTGIKDAPGIGIEEITVPDNYGNFQGNLSSENGAFAVVAKDQIFFASEGSLYKMDPYSKDTEKVVEHYIITCLNYHNGMVYYNTEDEIIRYDIRTGKEETVSDTLKGDFSIFDGVMYIDDEKSGGYIYSIDLDTLETKQMNSKTDVDYLNVTSGKIFYSDPENGNRLYTSAPDGEGESRLLSKPASGVSVIGDKVYCLSSGYEEEGETNILTLMSTDGGDMEILTNQPVSRFVPTENGIFYISSSTGYLEWMTLDGKIRYTILTSDISDFNIAGRWIFYKISGESGIYRVKIDGSEAERI